MANHDQSKDTQTKLIDTAWGYTACESQRNATRLMHVAALPMPRLHHGVEDKVHLGAGTDLEAMDAVLVA